mmetsp:Transcript_26138/g.57259  ORF Transcript_26138/g.57259 Transcript_26138/m.57259 type:complete len:279 (+) Transcript_26138:623-1459(+)
MADEVAEAVGQARHPVDDGREDERPEQLGQHAERRVHDEPGGEPEAAGRELLAQHRHPHRDERERVDQREEDPHDQRDEERRQTRRDVLLLVPNLEKRQTREHAVDHVEAEQVVGPERGPCQQPRAAQQNRRLPQPARRVAVGQHVVLARAGLGAERRPRARVFPDERRLLLVAHLVLHERLEQPVGVVVPSRARVADGAKRGGRAGGDAVVEDRALVEQQQTLERREDLRVWLVDRADDGDANLLGQVPQPLYDDLGGERVEARRGLVAEEERWVGK